MEGELKMFWKQVKRDGHERVFAVLKNGTTLAVNPGTSVAHDYTTAKDGSFILPTTAMLHAFAGVAWDVIGKSGAYNDVGKVLVYGDHPGVYMAGTTVTPGAMMIPVDGKSYVTLATTFAHADSTAEEVTFNQDLAFVIAGTTACLIATSTFGNTYRAFVRAL